MAFCRNCGSQIDDNTVICPRCGASQNGGAYYSGGENSSRGSYDSGGFGWGVLGFCIPLVGLILFLVWKDEKPNTAKSAGLGALISVCIYAAFYVIALLLGVGASVYYF